MRCLRSDGNAEREILNRSGEVIAPFVAAPKQEYLLQLHTAPKQRAIVAIGGQQHVFFSHCTGYPDRDRLLAERNGIGSKPASALQCDCLSVKEAQEHHGPVKRNEQAGIGGEGRERPVYRAVWREVVAAAHLEARDDGELLVRPFTGHVLAPWSDRCLPPLIWCFRRDDAIPLLPHTGLAGSIRASQWWYMRVWQMVRLS